MRLIFLIFLSFQFLIACGEGGSDSKTEMTNEFSVAGKDTDRYDLDDISSGIGAVAIFGSQVKNSNCFSELPSMEDFNSLYYERSKMAPTSELVIQSIDSEGEFGETISEIVLSDQNQKTLDLLTELLINVKIQNQNLIGISLEPMINKEVYKNIKNRCNDIECVSESVFGSTWGLRFFFKENFGIILSGHVSPLTKAYDNEDQILSVVKAILSLPKGSFPLNAENIYPPVSDLVSQNIIMAPHRIGVKGGAAAFNAFSRTGTNQLLNTDIYFLDPWTQSEDFDSKVATAFHELMHMFDNAKENKTVLSETKEWEKLSKWKFKDGKWKMGNAKVTCSEYGKTNPGEDFAECASMYRYAPAKLKKISNAKYNFFRKRVFDGVEYFDKKTCEDSVFQFQ